MYLPVKAAGQQWQLFMIIWIKLQAKFMLKHWRASEPRQSSLCLNDVFEVGKMPLGLSNLGSLADACHLKG